MNYELGEQLSSDQAMKFAADLAVKAWGRVKLNPMVGCCALDSAGRLVSSGYHESYGQAHAEVNALKNVDPEMLRGGTLFVSLEPCSHLGKTPPCSDLVVKYPLKKIVVGSIDPNPMVAGRGLEIIKSHGIEIELYEGKHKKQIDYLNEIFFHQMKKGESFWAMKVASSLDGVSSFLDGSSKWITNEKSRKYVHYLRGGFDAIAVGSGTLVADNPELNVRHPDFENQKKKLLVFERKLKIDSYQNFNFKNNFEKDDIYWISEGRNFSFTKDKNANKIYQLNWDSSADLIKLKAHLLKEEGVGSVFIEPGHGLFSQLLSRELVQRLYHFQAPVIMGGKNNVFSQTMDINSMEKKISMRVTHRRSFDGDLLTVYKIEKQNYI